MTISPSKSWGSNLYSGKFSAIFIDIQRGFGGFERGVLTVAMRECVMREREALGASAFLEGGRLTFAALWWPVCPVKSCHVKTSYSSTLTGASPMSLSPALYGRIFCHTTAPWLHATERQIFFVLPVLYSRSRGQTTLLSCLHNKFFWILLHTYTFLVCTMYIVFVQGLNFRLDI